MKNILFIKDNLQNKVTYYHLLLFVISLPFDRFYNQLVLFSWIFNTLIYLEKDDFKKLWNKYVLVLMGVFILNLITIIYSNDKTTGFEVLGKQAALFIIPVLFFLSSFNIFLYKINVLKVFSFTCVITILYLFIHAFLLISFHNYPVKVFFEPIFLNHNFSNPIKMHATLMSMYVCFSLIICVFLYYNSKTAATRILYIICAIILLAGIIQLASKSVIITLMLSVFLLFPNFINNAVKRKRYYIIAGVTFAVLFVAIISINSFKERLITEFTGDLVKDASNNPISEPRILRWEAALELIDKSPIFGFGSGSEEMLLQNKYFEKKLYNSYLFHLNTHNQYLEFLLTAGIIGLGVFMTVLFYGFKVAIKEKDILFIVFLLLISIVSFSDNILTVNKGIFFYAFFYSLFFRSIHQKSENHMDCYNEKII